MNSTGWYTYRCSKVPDVLDLAHLNYPYWVRNVCFYPNWPSTNKRSPFPCIHPRPPTVVSCSWVLSSMAPPSWGVFEISARQNFQPMIYRMEQFNLISYGPEDRLEKGVYFRRKFSVERKKEREREREKIAFKQFTAINFFLLYEKLMAHARQNLKVKVEWFYSALIKETISAKTHKNLTSTIKFKTKIIVRLIRQKRKTVVLLMKQK